MIKRELNIDEHKAKALDILIDVANFCEENNLRYFLAYGTLIGAIRHKGFIPWDDDIDIMMPRPDYEIFAKTYNNNQHNGNYKAVIPTDKIARHSFIKVCDFNTIKIEEGISTKRGYLGVDIDIFPLDGAPDDKLSFEELFNKKIKLFKRFDFIHGCFTKIGLSKNLVGFLKLVKRLWTSLLRHVLVILPSYKKGNILKNIYDLDNLYLYDESKYVCSLNCTYSAIKDYYEKKSFDDYIYGDFESHKFRIPVEYDKVLRDFYGDYMKLPPVEAQVTHHLNKVYEIIES